MSTTRTLGSALFDVPFAADVRHPDVSYVDPPAPGSELARSHATLSNDGHRELATLFAAAPDLLVAAEALVASSSGMHRGICNANHVGPLGGGGCSCPMGREFRTLRTAIARARGAA